MDKLCGTEVIPGLTGPAPPPPPPPRPPLSFVFLASDKFMQSISQNCFILQMQVSGRLWAGSGNDRVAPPRCFTPEYSHNLG